MIKTYVDGLKEAWEAAKWIKNASANALIAVFGAVSNWDAFTATEAIEKIEEYERREVHVGDIVRLKKTGLHYVITNVTRCKDGCAYNGFDAYGMGHTFANNNVDAVVAHRVDEVRYTFQEIMKDLDEFDERWRDSQEDGDDT